MRIAIIIVFSSIIMASCTKLDSYLDKAQTGGLTQEEIFQDYLKTRGFLANIYSALPDDWMPVYDFTYATASDEAKGAYNFATSGYQLNIGNLSPTANIVDIWSDTYAVLRKCNLFIQHVDEVPGTTPTQKDDLKRMKGEAYFLRAFFYFELFKRYGEVPLIDRALGSSDNLALPRDSINKVVSFIASDCDNAAALLPTTYKTDNVGRATNGAALALKSKMLLYAASPLFNPGKQTAKWQAAADAAKVVMNLNIYTLNEAYTDIYHTRYGKEVIFQSDNNETDWVQNMLVPSLSGWASLQPTENLVEDYEMANGKLTTEPGSGYDPKNPYLNRDPRLYMSVLANGNNWQGIKIYSYLGAPGDGMGNGNSNTQTGYYLGAKMLDENATVTPSYQGGNHYWVYLRYAEILLNYAEAQNEALSSPDPSVYNAINQVRARAGVDMPPIAAGLNKDQMREHIRHERRIELAFEAQRFWDVRRWQIGAQTEPDIYGMKITKNSDGVYSYARILVQQRIWKEAFNFFPIPQSERNRDLNLTQNAGYN